MDNTVMLTYLRFLNLKRHFLKSITIFNINFFTVIWKIDVLDSFMELSVKND